MSDFDIDPVKIGVMWQKVEAMEKEVAEMRSDIKELLAMANKGRGGFWVGMMVVSGLSSIVGYITHLFASR
jgi:hypothetical protein